MSPRGGVLMAASAVAAAAWHEIENRRVARADLPEENVRIVRLYDLRHDREALATIENGLRQEWGPFALLGFESIEDMASGAGKLTFIACQREGERYVPKASLQTSLTNVHGDAEAFRAEYPSFASLISPEGWRKARQGGDTAILMQITVLVKDERGGGLGSVLRNSVLHMLSREIGFCLTMTPVESATAVDFNDPKSFTPALRFHARGGAEPAIALPGFKPTPTPSDTAGAAGDVVVMRYARNELGEWSITRPDMQLHAMGPIEERLIEAVHRVQAWPAAHPQILTPDAQRRIQALPSKSRQALSYLTHRPAAEPEQATV
jgi:hypothetical protein